MANGNNIMPEGFNAIVLCAGRGTRWGGHANTLKQFVEVNGERIVDRTRRLLDERGAYDCCLVSTNVAFKFDSCSFLSPIACRWTVETLLSTRSKWASRTLVLLGDVWFTEETISRIVDYEGSLGFFGRRIGESASASYEFFGISFNLAGGQVVAENALRVRNEALKNGQGRIVDLYQSIQQQIAEKPSFDSSTVEFEEITDKTSDFDSPNDLHEWTRDYLR